ncbi:unnamed protein product [Cylicocyclus nassatus]|uniref:Uncharacterized protein n=1 Tax=Cylicocyclus nassatus TaxID=53992 RepID=A0AA36HC63_CYLNA|nr:unnamed protein product [Cylicocyclus nassatus]
MQDALTIGVEALGIAALILNLYALQMLTRTCQEKVGSRKPYLIMTVLNVLKALLFALSAPRAVTHEHCIVYIATGIVSSNIDGLLLLLFNYTEMLLYLLTILNSFLYKYIVLCRPRYYFIYQSFWVTAPGLANFVIVLNWLSGVVLQLLFRGELDKAELQKLSATARLAEGNIEKNSFLGFCSQDEGNWTQYIMLIETSITTSILFIIALHLAHQVKKKLKEPTLSSRTQELQNRLSNMLHAQALNLAVLLPGPLLLQPLFLICGLTTPASLVFLVTISISIFHMVNPIITIISLTGAPFTKKVSQSTTTIVVQTDANTFNKNKRNL